RDKLVTGVQTCALPIYRRERVGAPDGEQHRHAQRPRSPPAPFHSGAKYRKSPLPRWGEGEGEGGNCVSLLHDAPAPRRAAAAHRSEERRVGKEGRGRWW